MNWTGKIWLQKKCLRKWISSITAGLPGKNNRFILLCQFILQRRRTDKPRKFPFCFHFKFATSTVCDFSFTNSPVVSVFFEASMIRDFSDSRIWWFVTSHVSRVSNFETLELSACEDWRISSGGAAGHSKKVENGDSRDAWPNGSNYLPN